MKKPKVSLTVRVDPDVIDKAKSRGLNLSQLVRDEIERIVMFKKCPACGGYVAGE